MPPFPFETSHACSAAHLFAFPCPPGRRACTPAFSSSDHARVSLDDLASLAETQIGHSADQFRKPLQRDAQCVASTLGHNGEAVLLGSVASAKYTDVLLSLL